MALIPREPPEVVQNLRDELKRHGHDLMGLIERREAAGLTQEQLNAIDGQIEAKNDAIRRCKDDLRAAERAWQEQRRNEARGQQ